MNHEIAEDLEAPEAWCPICKSRLSAEISVHFPGDTVYVCYTPVGYCSRTYQEQWDYEVLFKEPTDAEKHGMTEEEYQAGLPKALKEIGGTSLKKLWEAEK